MIFHTAPHRLCRSRYTRAHRCTACGRLRTPMMYVLDGRGRRCWYCPQCAPVVSPHAIYGHVEGGDCRHCEQEVSA